jgi:hypothetical protein
MPAPVSPDAERLMDLAQAWVDRAVAVYAGDIPCNVSKYREAFREALFAQPDAGAMVEAESPTLIEHLVARFGPLGKDTMDLYNATVARREAAGFARGLSAREALFAQPDAGAMVEAENIVDGFFGGKFKAIDAIGSDFRDYLLYRIATALTRREAAGFAAVEKTERVSKLREEAMARDLAAALARAEAEREKWQEREAVYKSQIEAGAKRIEAAEKALGSAQWQPITNADKQVGPSFFGGVWLETANGWEWHEHVAFWSAGMQSFCDTWSGERIDLEWRKPLPTPAPMPARALSAAGGQ